jgi:hypothetical protein
VQLDRKMVVIDDALKRRRISQVCSDRYRLHFEPSVQLGPEAQNPLLLSRSCVLLRRALLERCSFCSYGNLCRQACLRFTPDNRHLIDPQKWVHFGCTEYLQRRALQRY